MMKCTRSMVCGGGGGGGRWQQGGVVRGGGGGRCTRGEERGGRGEGVAAGRAWQLGGGGEEGQAAGREGERGRHINPTLSSGTGKETFCALASSVSALMVEKSVLGLEGVVGMAVGNPAALPSRDLWGVSAGPPAAAAALAAAADSAAALLAAMVARAASMERYSSGSASFRPATCAAAGEGARGRGEGQDRKTTSDGGGVRDRSRPGAPQPTHAPPQPVCAGARHTLPQAPADPCRRPRRRPPLACVRCVQYCGHCARSPANWVSAVTAKRAILLPAPERSASRTYRSAMPRLTEETREWWMSWPNSRAAAGGRGGRGRGPGGHAPAEELDSRGGQLPTCRQAQQRGATVRRRAFYAALCCATLTPARLPSGPLPLRQSTARPPPAPAPHPPPHPWCAAPCRDTWGRSGTRQKGCAPCRQTPPAPAPAWSS